MKITGMSILTNNIQAMKEFYVQTMDVETDGDDKFVIVLAKGMGFSLCDFSIMEEMAPGSMGESGNGRYTLEVKVDDADELYKKLEEMNIPIVKQPTTQPWGRRSVWCRDPDGNIVNFYHTVKRRGIAK